MKKDLEDLNQTYEEFKETAKNGAGVKKLLREYSALNNAQDSGEVSYQGSQRKGQTKSMASAKGSSGKD
jgi:ABC-type transport system involved in cytochrome c biogenesis ATPase subunit